MLTPRTSCRLLCGERWGGPGQRDRGLCSRPGLWVGPLQAFEVLGSPALRSEVAQVPSGTPGEVSCPWGGQWGWEMRESGRGGFRWGGWGKGRGL